MGILRQPLPGRRLFRMQEWNVPFSTGPMVPMTVLTPFSLWNFSNSFLCFAALDSTSTVFCFFSLQLLCE